MDVTGIFEPVSLWILDSMCWVLVGGEVQGDAGCIRIEWGDEEMFLERDLLPNRLWMLEELISSEARLTVYWL